jgi:ParB family chromosome partitioning protein
MECAVRPMSARRYSKIPVDKIRVLNSRNRDTEKFKENIRSIRDVGLLKPILVNDRSFQKTGFYELICGQGRFMAYKTLEYTDIPAEIITCDRKQALIYSLVENIARVPPGTMWFARELKRMHDAGLSFDYIANVAGRSGTYIEDYIRLIERGEERLLIGVENNLFPISFATQVARSTKPGIQNILMDAFDKGIVNSKNLPTIRRILEIRSGHRIKQAKTDRGKTMVPNYSVKQLQTDIRKVTREKEAFVNEASIKENRLLTLLDGLRILRKDSVFEELLRTEGLSQLPQLQGEYNA